MSEAGQAGRRGRDQSAHLCCRLMTPIINIISKFKQLLLPLPQVACHMHLQWQHHKRHDHCWLQCVGEVAQWFQIEITTQLQLKQNNLNKIEAADKRAQCKYRACVCV